MKTRFTRSNILSIAILGALGPGAGCGSSVAGSTYADNGGVVQIEFKSGGKAFVSTGPFSHACTYSESGKSVTLICDGDKTAFTVDDDALNGPPDGYMGRLTKKK